MKNIWKHKLTPKDINNWGTNTLTSHLGIEVIEVGHDFIKAKMPVDNKTKQPMGLLHGGASAALSETMGSIASTLCIEDITKQHPVGIDINATHIKSVTGGYVFAVTKPIKMGRKLHVWQTNIFDKNENLVCSSRLSVMIIEAKNQIK